MEFPSPQHEIATRLLMCCYQSIDGDYRQRYRMDIWKQVEGKCRSAANQSPTLTRWVQAFLSFPHTEIRDPLALVASLTAADERQVLRIYREEPAVVVAYLRYDLEQQREAVAS